MMTSYLFGRYHIRESHRSGDKTQVSVQLGIEHFLRAEYTNTSVNRKTLWIKNRKKGVQAILNHYWLLL